MIKLEHVIARNLFTFSGFDIVDFGELQYYDAIFIKDFKQYKVGDTISCISIDFINGKYTIYDNNGQSIDKGNYNVNFE